MTKIIALRDSKRASKFFNHLSAISDGIPALGWVVVSPTPGPYIADMRGGSELYSNRILKDFKGKDETQVNWVNSFKNFLKELQDYVKAHHTTGLEWNSKGGDATSHSGSSSSTPAPPPPPPVFIPAEEPEKKNNLFAELSKGTDISKGLKKVTNDMKTKNRDPNERSSVVPATALEKKAAASKSNKTEITKPPKFALEASKWAIENQVDNRTICIEDTEAKQTCYVYKCTRTTIQIKGKINAIVVDSCTKCAIVFENLVSSVDIVNCNSIEMQVLGAVPCINVDKTSGCQLYLGKDALHTEIFSSKSSEMNVSIPGPSEGDDPVEIAIPEQFKTVIKGGKLITECNSHV